MSLPAAPGPPFVIHSARIVPGRPPSARLTLDVEVGNLAARPRWALLPGQLPPDEGGVFAVETLRGGGRPPVVAARVLGRGGRLAVLVASRARVRLRDVEITWWGPPPDRIEVVLELADAVAVGSRPLGTWLAAAPAAMPDGADASLAGAVVLDSRTTDGLVDVPLELEGAIETAIAGVAVERRA